MPGISLLVLALTIAALSLTGQARAETVEYGYIIPPDADDNGFGVLVVSPGTAFAPNTDYSLTLESGDLTLGAWYLRAYATYDEPYEDGSSGFEFTDMVVRANEQAVFYSGANGYRTRYTLIASLKDNVAHFRYSIFTPPSVCIDDRDFDPRSCNYQVQTPLYAPDFTYWHAHNTVGGPGYLTSGSPTPEPATWTCLLLGFGITGAALRRRSSLRI